MNSLSLSSTGIEKLKVIADAPYRMFIKTLRVFIFNCYLLLSEGFLKEKYIETAKFIGFDAKTGSIAYSSMDIALSGYGLARSVLKPNAYRLFTFMPSDFVRNYKNMSVPALTIEAMGDVLSIRSAINAEN